MTQSTNVQDIFNLLVLFTSNTSRGIRRLSLSTVPRM